MNSITEYEIDSAGTYAVETAEHMIGPIPGWILAALADDGILSLTGCELCRLDEEELEP